MKIEIKKAKRMGRKLRIDCLIKRRLIMIKRIK